MTILSHLFLLITTAAFKNAGIFQNISAPTLVQMKTVREINDSEIITNRFATNWNMNLFKNLQEKSVKEKLFAIHYGKLNK